MTDPAGRQTLNIDYYNKGAELLLHRRHHRGQGAGTNLTNPKINDHVSKITDISGRKLSFIYTAKGLLGEFTDGAGSTNGSRRPSSSPTTSPRATRTSSW